MPCLHALCVRDEIELNENVYVSEMGLVKHEKQISCE